MAFEGDRGGREEGFFWQKQLLPPSICRDHLIKDREKWEEETAAADGER